MCVLWTKRSWSALVLRFHIGFTQSSRMNENVQFTIENGASRSVLPVPFTFGEFLVFVAVFSRAKFLLWCTTGDIQAIPYPLRIFILAFLVSIWCCCNVPYMNVFYVSFWLLKLRRGCRCHVQCEIVSLNFCCNLAKHVVIGRFYLIFRLCIINEAVTSIFSWELMLLMIHLSGESPASVKLDLENVHYYLTMLETPASRCVNIVKSSANFYNLFYRILE